MTAKNLAYGSGCVIALLLAGCGGKVMDPSYYTLVIPAAPKPAAGNALVSATVAVRRFETPSYLRQGRIVFKEAPQQVGFYEYRRWASDPAVSVTEAMIDSLRYSRLFSSVRPYEGQDKSDYAMSGRIERLEEVDYGGSVRVEAKLSADLVDARTGATVWSDGASTLLAVDTRDVSSVVIEMSHAMEKNIAELVGSLREQLRTGNP